MVANFASISGPRCERNADQDVRAYDEYHAPRTHASDALMRSLGAFVNPIRRNPQIGVMMIILILVMAGAGLIAPILSIYAKVFATSTTLAGMVITIFGVARLLANYPAGALSQHYGRRRLLIVGLVVAAAGSLASALAPSIGWLIVWQFLQGAGSGIYMTVSTAAMADLARRMTAATSLRFNRRECGSVPALVRVSAGCWPSILDCRRHFGPSVSSSQRRH
jgi:MFS family permease